MANKGQFSRISFFEFIDQRGGTKNNVCAFLEGGGRFGSDTNTRTGETELIKLAMIMEGHTDTLELYFGAGGKPDTA